MVGLLYALPTTQLTRRLAREGRLFPLSYAMQLDSVGAGDQSVAGLNFTTLRPRRDILQDYRTVLARIYRPASYWARVRTVARMLDRPVLDTSASRDPPMERLFGIPKRSLRLLWRLVGASRCGSPGHWCRSSGRFASAFATTPAR